ncbi:MAG: hypothetical protein GVY04_00855 [Cyanobacteria bacterium]|jgi:hypothetical protein|nr:hypothetical protein [Cyanobacteria bacterium GSL.Bin1]
MFGKLSYIPNRFPSFAEMLLAIVKEVGRDVASPLAKARCASGTKPKAYRASNC